MEYVTVEPDSIDYKSIRTGSRYEVYKGTNLRDEACNAHGKLEVAETHSSTSIFP